MGSLTAQSVMAADFLAQGWSQIRDRAQELLSAWNADIELVILCGCGDSHHAAQCLEMAFMTWTNKRIWAAPAMKAARYLIPELGSASSRTLVVGLSASGEVARTREAIELAFAAGAHTLALTGGSDNTLAQTAHSNLSLPTPPVAHGPGLLSYLASLLMGYALASSFASDTIRQEIDSYIKEVPFILEDWREGQVKLGRQFAEDTIDGSVVFLGSGPAYGTALFSAAKLIEAVGIHAWGQDVEEWTHLEYFCNPANMPTWLLSAGGRSTSREEEMKEAAKILGRRIAISNWEGGKKWSPYVREVLAPLGLWVGPVAYASSRADLVGEQPFRGFGGGRNRQEGGGASLIRISERLSLRDFKVAGKIQ